MYDRNTLIEEHISGIPGNMFIRSYLSDRHLDEVRLAKEFVKFNERCFLRLLGDMHSANFVIDITPDFEVGCTEVISLRLADWINRCVSSDILSLTSSLVTRPISRVFL